MPCHLELVQQSQRLRRAEQQKWKHVCYRGQTVTFLPHGEPCPICGEHEPLELTGAPQAH